MSSTNSWNFYRGIMDEAGVEKINYLKKESRILILTQAQIEARLEKERKEWDKKQNPCEEAPLPYTEGVIPKTWQIHPPTECDFTVIGNPIVVDEAVDPITMREMEEKLRDQIMRPIMPRRTAQLNDPPPNYAAKYFTDWTANLTAADQIVYFPDGSTIDLNEELTDNTDCTEDEEG